MTLSFALKFSMTTLLEHSEAQPTELPEKLIQQNELDQKGPKITFYFQSPFSNFENFDFCIFKKLFDCINFEAIIYILFTVQH